MRLHVITLREKLLMEDRSMLRQMTINLTCFHLREVNSINGCCQQK